MSSVLQFGTDKNSVPSNNSSESLGSTGRGNEYTPTTDGEKLTSVRRLVSPSPHTQAVFKIFQALQCRRGEPKSLQIAYVPLKRRQPARESGLKMALLLSASWRVRDRSSTVLK